jgi:hypothetical protein
MGNDWKPITDSDFEDLFKRQYAELNKVQQSVFDRVRVPFWKAKIRRSESMGDESVIVVAQSGNGVLYFDDVEYGFNISTIDASGKILTPGGSQNTLKEAVEQWFSFKR